MIKKVITNYLVYIYVDPSEPLELSWEPDLGNPPPDPLFDDQHGDDPDIKEHQLCSVQQRGPPVNHSWRRSLRL